MKRLGTMAAAALVMIGMANCQRGPATMPTKKVPAGEVHLAFTRKVKGPLDLSIDGVRIPVEQKRSAGKTLVVTGLKPGKHRFFLNSASDAFGPDQAEVELKEGTGTYLMLFSQSFKATLYGSREALPAAEGLPGVKARLEK